MPSASPLIDDNPGGNPSMFGGGAQANVGPLSGEAAAGVNYAEGEHPTHYWVAGVMLFALVGIIFLHVSGFRFSTDVGVTRG
jgi:hypothetical protein